MRLRNLIGLFANRQIPAVGFAFGFDRLMEAMEEQNLFPANLNTTKVLVTVFSPELLDNSIRVCEILSQNNINQELYVDPNAKMEKQLKYADKKQIPYVVIIGPDEAKNNTVTVKNLKTREQKALPFDQFLDLFKE
ncbi:MAG: Histidyl-tRNA synthetase [Microgenomates group bacterium GW2011_GWC1_39_7]|nr:MAG: Histidyl-tRNA synthetase [Microgenomates group bacterium GW2011_GWC1_39_7]